MQMLSVKLHPEHYDFLLRGAKAAGAESLSEYVRGILFPAVAAELGEPVPELSEPRPASVPPPAAPSLEARLEALETLFRSLLTDRAARPTEPVRLGASVTPPVTSPVTRSGTLRRVAHR